ncbi:OmpA family protein [Oceaniglobus roseus]|uniref:OmpA family protein n=1 Tax=Oceaniglobus roseus TaxID=1737570 RepID=UPI00156280D7|nr:OmpA family protein [Kandeliimicrobium roseum]
MPRTTICALCLAALPQLAAALTLDFPARGTLTAQRLVAEGRESLPVSAFADGAVQTRAVEGQVTRKAWKIPVQGITTTQLLSPLRRQLTEDGYDVVFECQDVGCGGFDFRYAMDVVNEPDMHVDLGDFRYLMAQKGEGDAVALLVSRAPQAGFVQMTRISPPEAEPAVIATSTKSVDPLLPRESGDVTAELRQAGRAPLDDLLFGTGSADLEEGQFDSLNQLAAYLRDNPGQSLTLVGHTDDEGALAANIALSKRRAKSVMDRLVRDYGAPRDRLRFEGVGFLAPRASNSTDDGRLANRRVEAILTP